MAVLRVVRLSLALKLLEVLDVLVLESGTDLSFVDAALTLRFGGASHALFLSLECGNAWRLFARLYHGTVRQFRALKNWCSITAAHHISGCPRGRCTT